MFGNKALIATVKKNEARLAKLEQIVERMLQDRKKAIEIDLLLVEAELAKTAKIPYSVR